MYNARLLRHSFEARPCANIGQSNRVYDNPLLPNYLQPRAQPISSTEAGATFAASVMRFAGL